MVRMIRALCFMAALFTALGASAVQEQEDRMMTQVHAMIASVVKEKRSLTPEEVNAIELMTQTLKDITLPAVEKGHDDEQQVVDAAYGSFVDCNAKLGTDGSDVEGKATLSAEKYDAHGSCRFEESGLAEANKTAWEDLKQFLNELPAPPEKEKKYLGLTSWFQDGFSYFETHGPSYAEKKKAFTDALAAYDEKKEECDTAEGAYQSAVCSWKEAALHVISHHDSCWTEAGQYFETVTLSAADSAEQRTAEYSAANKLLCFLDILNELITTKEVPGDIDDQLKKCDELEAETEKFALTNTTAPAKSEAKFEVSLGVDETIVLPGGGAIPGVTCGDDETIYETETVYETEKATAPPRPPPVDVTLEGDFTEIVKNKDTFLEECSETYKIKCVDVKPGFIELRQAHLEALSDESKTGTIVITMEAENVADLKEVEETLKTEPFKLPSTPEIPVESLDGFEEAIEEALETTYDIESM